MKPRIFVAIPLCDYEAITTQVWYRRTTRYLVRACLESFARHVRTPIDLCILADRCSDEFVHTAEQVNSGSRAYKDINRLAFGLLDRGGVLATFSCSGHVDAALFQKIVAGAAVDAGRTAQILERLSQPPDHPVATEFPEAEYLKGLILRVH